MATAGRQIAELLEESKKLEAHAQKIQGDRELLVGADIVDALAMAYQEWFARAVSVLPPEYEERLRQEYEGKWYSQKIKSFLASPGEVSMLWSEEVPDSPLPYWQHPYESTFKAPLMTQRQILAEARQGLEGPGQASQDLDLLERICRRFPEFLRPFAARSRGRAPFVIEDEYDVQTAMHAILRLFFDDVRPEDFAPQRAGARSRVDFLLKAERVVVETKMTRTSLAMKAVGEELIIDIERYKAHPDCGALVAFVYDPDKLIANRRALEHDLSRAHDGLVVRVHIAQ